MSTYTDLRKQYLEEWRIWYRMCHVCEHDTKYYVEVEVCKEWQGEQGFINWFDEMGPRPPGAVMDRINKFGDYEPGNTQWVTKSESQWNSRAHNTQEHLKWRKIAKTNGIARHTFYTRISRGWTWEDAATLPPSQKRYKTRIT